MSSPSTNKPHWMSQHRTICATLYDIKQKLPAEHKHLADEAMHYARKMSAKLGEYKQREASGTLASNLNTCRESTS